MKTRKEKKKPCTVRVSACCFCIIAVMFLLTDIFFFILKGYKLSLIFQIKEFLSLQKKQHKLVDWSWQAGFRAALVTSDGQAGLRLSRDDRPA